MASPWQTTDNNNQQWFSSGSNDWFNSGGSATGPGGDSLGYDIPVDNNELFDQSVAQDYYGSGKGTGANKTSTKNAAQKSPANYFFDQQPVPTPRSSNNNFFANNNYGNSSPSYWSTPGPRNDADVEDERPLLDELGINFDHIRQKTFAVLNPLMTPDVSVLNDNDLAGPLVFCLLFGFSLLLHGKVQFGYIYGIGLLGCLSMYALLNLMSLQGITLTCAVSVLGYCLLPMSLLSLVAAVFSFKGTIGLGVAIAAVLWCSLSASKLFVTALAMDKQRILVAYPCSLFFGVFALLAIY